MLREQERKKQFPDTPEAFRNLNQECLSRYHAYFSLAPANNSAELRAMLDRRDREILISRAVLWKFHDNEAAFFLWLVDDMEAIFTFKNVGRKDVGLSFPDSRRQTTGTV